jgi:uncharacterized protein (DUF433 family)
MNNVWQKYIISDPAVLLGKPIIKGTRVPIELVLERLSFGETTEQLLQSFPNLSKEVILACLSYASASLQNEVEYPLAS